TSPSRAGGGLGGVRLVPTRPAEKRKSLPAHGARPPRRFLRCAAPGAAARTWRLLAPHGFSIRSDAKLIMNTAARAAGRHRFEYGWRRIDFSLAQRPISPENLAWRN